MKKRKKTEKAEERKGGKGEREQGGRRHVYGQRGKKGENQVRKQ